MATNPRSAASFPSAEVVGPFVEYDELERTLGPAHPSMCTVDETLFYYDGPQCWIGRVSGDARPRLNVLVEEGRTGEGVDTVFTSRYQQFVFVDETLLRSTLREGMAPTGASYELAHELIMWETQSGHVDNTERRSLCRTWFVTVDDVRDDIVVGNKPDGIRLNAAREGS